MKKTLALVLCLGLITFLLLACISTPEKIGEKKTQKGKSTKSLEFKAGDEIKIREKILVVAGITRNWQSSSQFMEPSEGKEFVLIGISLANLGQNAIDLSPWDFKIQDSAGVRTTPSSYPDIPEAFPLFVELGPQGKLSGNLLFEVKAGDQSLKFIFRSSPFEAEVVVNL